MRGRLPLLLLPLLGASACPDFPAYLLHRDAAPDTRGPDRRADVLDARPGEGSVEARADRPVDRLGPDARRDSTDLDRPPDLKPDASKPLDLKPDASKPLDLKPDTAPVAPGTWVLVPKGTFLMGSPPAEPCGGSGETQHQVTLTQPFAISTTEVTQAQFELVRGYNPSVFTSCAPCPVESVTWHEAAAYCNELSSLAKAAPCYVCTGSGATVTCSEAASYAAGAVYLCPGYRLPTEAEWEYAYRATTTTALYSGPITANCNKTDPNADAIAWYSMKNPMPVALKQANLWQIRDMAGNVREWTHDSMQSWPSTPIADPWVPTGPVRVYKGGSWSDGLKTLRAAYRGAYSAGGRSNDIGFRCVRTQ